MSKGEELFGSTYEKGEIIFHEGDMGDAMFIIQSGAVEISRLQEDKKVVLALLNHNDFFGEMALIDNRPRSATAASISKSRLLPFTRASLKERIRHDPGVIIHLLKTICRRITDTNLLLISKIQNDENLRFIIESRCREDPCSDPETEGETDQAALKHTAFQQSTGKSMSELDSVPPKTDLPIDRGECTVFEPGQSIVKQGDSGSSLFIVVEGEVKISQGFGAEKQVLAVLGPGEFFGETAVITDQPRTADASAIKTALLLPLSQKDFLERIQAQPELALYILQGLIMRLRRMLTILISPDKSVDKMIVSLPPLLKKKDRVRAAVISLSTCGGCSAALLEDQAALLGLLDKLNISYCPMLMDKDEIGEVDVALVDGLVRVREDEEKLAETRRKSRYLMAWGTCASFGGIPAFANQYELEELIKESYGSTEDSFEHYLSGTRGIDYTTFQEQEKELKLLRRASKLDEFVRVDYYIPGCPPSANLFIQFLNELRGEGEVSRPRPLVCTECGRKHVKEETDNFRLLPGPAWDADQCFVSRGSICMGFITRGGCGAVCTKGGLPCWGCRGPSEPALKKMDEGNSFSEILMNSLINRHQHLADEIKSVMRIFRKHGSSSLKFNRYFTQDRSRIR